MEMNATLAWLNDLLPALQIGRPQTHDNLTLVPIHGPETGPELITLDQALAEGSAEITEMNEAGSVPTLQVNNRGKLALLLFDGEELVGAKQNRILNTSILVAAGTSVAIPVSCVEQGRWAWRTRHFGTEGRMMKQGMRSAKAARMSDSLASTPAVYDADQQSVWNEVAEYAQRRGTFSRTSAMADVFESDRPAIDQYVKAFGLEAGQTGQAAFVNGRLIGIDLLGKASAFVSLYPKLLRGLAAEAVDIDRGAGTGDEQEVLRLLRTLPHSASFEASPPGLGRDVRFRSDSIHAAGLVAEAGLIHLAVFPVIADSNLTAGT